MLCIVLLLWVKGHEQKKRNRSVSKDDRDGRKKENRQERRKQGESRVRDRDTNDDLRRKKARAVPWLLRVRKTHMS